MVLPVPVPVTVAVTVAGALPVALPVALSVPVPVTVAGALAGALPVPVTVAVDLGRGPWAGPYPCPCGSIIAFNLPPSIPSQHSLSPTQAH